MKSAIVNCAPAEVTYRFVPATITKFPVLLASRIRRLIEMLHGYLARRRKPQPLLSPQKRITYSPLNGSHPVAKNALTSRRAKPAQSKQGTFLSAS